MFLDKHQMTDGIFSYDTYRSLSFKAARFVRPSRASKFSRPSRSELARKPVVAQLHISVMERIDIWKIRYLIFYILKTCKQICKQDIVFSLLCNVYISFKSKKMYLSISWPFQFSWQCILLILLNFTVINMQVYLPSRQGRRFQGWRRLLSLPEHGWPLFFLCQFPPGLMVAKPVAHSSEFFLFQKIYWSIYCTGLCLVCGLYLSSTWATIVPRSLTSSAKARNTLGGKIVRLLTSAAY